MNRAIKLTATAVLAALTLTGCFYGGGGSEPEPTGTATVDAATSSYPDNDASVEGSISVEPFTLTLDPGAGDPVRAFPELSKRFLVPSVGVDVVLTRTKAPEAGWDATDHTLTLSEAHIITSDGYGTPTYKDGTVVVAMNARATYDAAGNPLLNEELVEDAQVVIDGVEYAYTSAELMSVDDLALNAEPFVKERGRAVVLVYQLDESAEPTGNVLALVAHRTANQDYPAERFQ